jgi:hypothetical protein
MNYQEKVENSKKLLDKINSLKDKEAILVEFGVDRFSKKPREFRIRAYKNFKGEGVHYSIWEEKGLGGMNISKVGKTTMKGYTYDMMSQKTTFTFPLYEMNIVEPKS